MTCVRWRGSRALEACEIIGRTLEERARPSPQVSCRFVGPLREREEGGIRIRSEPYRLIRQDPLVHAHVVARRRGTDHRGGAAGWLGIRIGIKRRLRDRCSPAAGPPPDADALV